MKKIILLPLLTLLFSCGDTTGKYEKLIAEIVQTDKRGTKYDLNFKVIKLEEIQQISITDSIKIITDAFNADRDKRINNLNETIKRNIEHIDKEKNSRIQSKAMMEFYLLNVDKANKMIDSLNLSTPIETVRYDGRSNNEILAIVVRCMYSIDELISEKRVTETFDFFLSPDGTKYYTKKRVK